MTETIVNKKIKNVFIGTSNGIKMAKKGWIGINNSPKLSFIKKEKKDLLPNGYTMVEYIQTNGIDNLYIKLGMQMASIDMSFEVLEPQSFNTNTKTLLALQAQERKDVFHYWRSQISFAPSYNTYRLNDTYLYKNSAEYNNSFPIELNSTINYTNLSKSSKDKLYTIVNDNISKEYLSSNWIAKLNDSYGLYLFGTPYDTNTNGCPIRLYICKIYGSEKRKNISRFLIPCIQKSDNTPGLYDLKSKIFFTNNNNKIQTKFIAGPEL